MTRKHRAEAKATAVRDRAREAAARVAPVAKRTGETAAQRVHGARRWAAPRIEQAAHTVQDTVAPKVSAALEATAHRIEPAATEPGRGGRISRALRIGGVAALTALAGAIMALSRRRRDTTTIKPNGTDEGPADAVEPTGRDDQAASDAEAGYNGQTQTPHS